eukprot:CAMPEP_0175068112 /NCGR_PEP_ID=MMETSP0052_2-20121109/17490_1 /TAXON_ID=51329 ORGANISM="Polytomella parva, Strain SAG 63-3" /NCGR_SAMPLE_ID=MMETSP0052_2 /ASSEMBLY_ACC=CAM_ASM_000194 /LENGTH=843 /DNA_ID=CAMNT_0016335103 /DNA_START=194 /DNA_END=2725 /DNA_ORIENTATION=-
MSDYSKIGVQDIEEKQKLFRVIKHLSANRLAEQQVQRPTPKVVQQDKHNGLLDLEEQDGDLLSDDGHAYNISPMGQAHQRPRSAQPPQYAAPIPLAFPTPVTNSDEDPPKIRVVVRKRPISRKERERGDEDIVDVSIGGAFVIVNETKVKVDLTKYLEKHQFNFDDAIDDTVGNDAVYRSTVQPLVGTLFRNGKASCFAYGQTGSGKTYTMSPLPTRAAADIFQYLARPDYRDIALHVSCFEIYGNKVFDLLNQRKKLNILEDAKKKVVVVGLKEFVVDTVDSVKQLIEESSTRRSTGSTAANSDSSRSHSIMQFALKRMPPPAAAAAAARFGGEPVEAKLVGKISFIDLAGSERGADTFDNNRQTRLEGAEINKSLLALKECIRALDSDARHVPFRGSKLTAVLRDSFVGDQARTVMIANISPCSTSVEHTLNTLRYADRVKELRKEKCDRNQGGVTPGAEQYHAAVIRASSAVPPSPAGGGGGGGGLGGIGIGAGAGWVNGADGGGAIHSSNNSSHGVQNSNVSYNYNYNNSNLNHQQYHHNANYSSNNFNNQLYGNFSDPSFFPPSDPSSSPQPLSTTSSMDFKSNGPRSPPYQAPQARIQKSNPSHSVRVMPNQGGGESNFGSPGLSHPLKAAAAYGGVAGHGSGARSFLDAGDAHGLAPMGYMGSPPSLHSGSKMNQGVRDRPQSHHPTHLPNHATPPSRPSTSHSSSSSVNPNNPNHNPNHPIHRPTSGESDVLALRHDQLMDSILLEEESLVSFHRSKLEEDMELMRREMTLLQEVDQPGSEIDDYVSQMTQLLMVKKRSVEELLMRIEAFKGKLKEEEALSRTVVQQEGGDIGGW